MLKLTTDKHEASRGLSATAELLVLSIRSLLRPYNVPKMPLLPGLCPGPHWRSLRSPRPPSQLGGGYPFPRLHLARRLRCLDIDSSAT